MPDTMLSGGECLRLGSLEFDSETENCELCVQGLLGNILQQCTWKKVRMTELDRERTDD